jgi:hypothetical protein
LTVFPGRADLAPASTYFRTVRIWCLVTEDRFIEPF